MTKPKIIYLAAFKANHPNHDMVYQDINGQRDIGGDMLDVDLTPYDIIIATPPCNYYSKLNYRRDTSKYAQLTKHLLPTIIKRLAKQEKPFLIENVRSTYIDNIILNSPDNVFVYQHGRHTYWTNIMVDFSNVKQESDFSSGGKRTKGGYILNDGTFSKTNRVTRLNDNTQGGNNVHNVIERWLEVAYDYAQNNNRTGESGTL